MGYKFNTKLFSLAEKHPISKQRFEVASQFIQSNFTDSHMDEGLALIWEGRENKKFLQI
jgi:hypothetical protein